SGKTQGSDRKLPTDTHSVAYSDHCTFPLGALRNSLTISKRRLIESRSAFSLTRIIEDKTHGGTRRSDLRSSGSFRGDGAILQPLAASIGPMAFHGNLGCTTSP